MGPNKADNFLINKIIEHSYPNGKEWIEKKISVYFVVWSVTFHAKR